MILIEMLVKFLKGLFMLTDPETPPSVVPPPVVIPVPGEVGVKYNPPPPSILPSIMDAVTKATADMEPGSVAIAAVADYRGGWNGVAVYKGSHGLSVDAWIGQSWGTNRDFDFGARLLYTRKIG